MYIYIYIHQDNKQLRRGPGDNHDYNTHVNIYVTRKIIQS